MLFVLSGYQFCARLVRCPRWCGDRLLRLSIVVTLVGCGARLHSHSATLFGAVLVWRGERIGLRLLGAGLARCRMRLVQ